MELKVQNHTKCHVERQRNISVMLSETKHLAFNTGILRGVYPAFCGAQNDKQDVMLSHQAKHLETLRFTQGDCFAVSSFVRSLH